MKFRFIMRILIFKTGALGDILMTTPFVRQLRKSYPDAKIDYLIGKNSAIILKNNFYINSIIKFDEKIFTKKKLFSWLKLVSDIKRKKYDIIFVLDKHWIFNLTAKLFVIKQRVGFDRIGKEGIFLTNKVNYEQVRHEVYYYLDLLKKTGKLPNYNDFKHDLFLTEKDKLFAKSFWKNNFLDKNIIAIMPGGGNISDKWSYMRIYPVNKYIQLIKKLIKKHKIILLGKGEVDEKIVNKILSEIKSKNLISLVSKTSIHETAAVLEECSKIYCNDTGGMHIAASVNKNIHSFFIVTNPLKKAPLWKTSEYEWFNKEIYNPKCELFGDYSYYLDKFEVDE